MQSSPKTPVSASVNNAAAYESVRSSCRISFNCDNPSTPNVDKKAVTSFFAAFDTLCEEGTVTTVCRALDEVADISIPGSKDHIKEQGEILEGIVARIVSHESSKHMERVLEDFPPPPMEGVQAKSTCRLAADADCALVDMDSSALLFNQLKVREWR